VPAPFRMDALTRSKLLLVLCGICWGINWPLIKIGISGLSPWTYRLTVFVVGTAILMAVVVLTGRPLMEPRGRTWMHLFASSMLNVAAFGIFSTFAMLTASTSRFRSGRACWRGWCWARSCARAPCSAWRSASGGSPFWSIQSSIPAR
jgi:hypothetical protein